MNRSNEQEQLHAIDIYTDYETTNFSTNPEAYETTNFSTNPEAYETTNFSTTPEASIVLEKEYDEPEEITKLSLFGKVKSWYKPTYIKSADALDDDNPKLRYCNGRMSKRKFVLFHCMTIFTILNIILTPLTYFVFIPATINHKVQTLNLNDINIDHMDVKEWRPDGLIFSWKAAMPKPFALSIKTKLSALDLKIHDDHSNNLMTVKVPETVVDIGKPIVLEFEGEVILEEGLKDVIGRISQPGGMQGAVFTAETRVSITMGGVTWYKHLKIKRTFKIPKLDGSLTSLLSIMPSNILAKGSQGVTTGNNTETIEVGGANVTFRQLLPNLPPISIKSLDVVFTDAGPNIILKTLLENPTVLSLPLPDMSFGLQLEGSYLSTANIKGFNLVRGLNDLEINLQLTFDQSRIVSPDQLSDSITEAAGKLLGMDKEGVKLNVIGPIELQNVNIIGDITEKLSLTLPIDDILKNTNSNSLKNSPGANGFGSILQAISFSAVGNQIVVPANITLPSFLPLPPSFQFNYNTSFGIFKGEQIALTIGIGRILMTNDGEKLAIQTTIFIQPNNSSESILALSSIFSPLLVGKATSLDIKNIKLTSDTGESFPWVDGLFGKLTIHVPIPGLGSK